MYSIKETFRTLQGEGWHAGRVAVFCRFAGCNLWTGREEDREKSICKFCDTDFVGTDGDGGGKFREAAALVAHIDSFWRGAARQKFVVLTGGEPLLQVDTALVDALHDAGYEVAVETNGTVEAPPGLDWITVSPKGRSSLRITQGHELKFVYPQTEIEPEQFAGLCFDYFYLQPKDDARRVENLAAAVDYCLNNPAWRLSIQTHKVIGIQ